MIDRYDGETIELDLEQRDGYKFIASASAIYDALNHVSPSKKIKEKLKTLRAAMDLAGNLWLASEQKRPAFTLPAGLKHDYDFAKKRYLFTKANPNEYYEKNMEQREELEKERKLLVDKITTKEGELALAEDVIRHEVSKQRIDLNQQLAVLAAKRRRYEAMIAKNSPSLLSSCLGTYQDRLPVVIEKMTALEEQIKQLTKQTSPDIEDRQYQLNLLRDRRFRIGKILHVRNDHHPIHMARWQNAVDIAQTVMLVREMDIDSAVRRYYSGEPVNIAHAFLIVYGQIKEILSQPMAINDEIKQQIIILAECADNLHAPSVGGRSVETLYKKVLELKEEDRWQVLYQKPEKNNLPAVLLQTLSLQTAQKNEPAFGLYRKVLSQHAADMNEDLPKIRIK